MCDGRDRGRERGSVVMLTAAFAVVALLLVYGLGRLGAGVVARARAQAAADAAALAGAADGRAAAEQVASANGATITEWRQSGRDVRVAVALEQAGAAARARRMPPPTRGWPAQAPSAVESAPPRAANPEGGVTTTVTTSSTRGAPQ